MASKGPYVTVKWGGKTSVINSTTDNLDAIRNLKVAQFIQVVAQKLDIKEPNLRLVYKGESTPKTPKKRSSHAKKIHKKFKPIDTSSVSNLITVKTLKNDPEQNTQSIFSWITSFFTTPEDLDDLKPGSYVYLNSEATLADYGIRDKSAFYLLKGAAKKTVKKPAKPPATINKKPESTPIPESKSNPVVELTHSEKMVNKVNEVLDSVDTDIIPHVKEYEGLSESLKEGKSSDEDADLKKFKYLHAFCSDQLEKSIFKLDAVQSEESAIREKRKGAVRTIQAHLSHIDSIKKDTLSVVESN